MTNQRPDPFPFKGDPAWDKWNNLNPVEKPADPMVPAMTGPDPWVARSDNMKCKTCMWFVPKTVIGSNSYDVGRCRRHAPTMGGYPVVMVNDWCGDHRLDETKRNAG